MGQRQIVIVGSGFAGVWAALGAAAVVHDLHAENSVQITVVSRDGFLTVRPRLYESDLAGVRIPLEGVLSPVGVREHRGAVESIDFEHRELTLAGDRAAKVSYHQLVLCAGSQLTVPGDRGTVHNADSYAQSLGLHEAVGALGRDAGQELSATVVGGGFTGLELSAELSDMLVAVAKRTGRGRRDRMVRLVERAPFIAPEFGPTARASIEAALRDLDVETHLGVRVTAVDAHSVTLEDGRCLRSGIVVWAAGPRATRLNEQLGVELDARGRVNVDACMATTVDDVWAAGDAARAVAVDDEIAPMSCQHAMPQGRQAGENAALAALGRPPGEYHQPLYATCLDLGSAGAILTCGFERDDVIATGAQAKRLKRSINRSVIYPPTDAAGLLKLGGTPPPGPAAAKLYAFALRRSVLRNAAIARHEDRATQLAISEGS